MPWRCSAGMPAFSSERFAIFAKDVRFGEFFRADDDWFAPRASVEDEKSEQDQGEAV